MEPVSPKTPTIAVQTRADVDIEPSGARMHVELFGQTLLRSTAAIKQAQAVRKLVEALRDSGVTDEHIGVTHVSVSVDKGLVGRSSQATYRLVIAIEDTSQLAAVLDAVTQQGTATVRHIDWRYEEHAVRAQLMERCGAQARELANRAASGLGQKVIRILEFRESGLQPASRQRELMADASPAASGPKRSSVASSFEGIAIVPKRTVRLSVSAWFEVG